MKRLLFGIILITILVASLSTMALLFGPSHHLSYQVLAGELSFSLDNESVVSINPSKVEVSKSTEIPVTIHNNSNKPIKLLVSSRVADYVTGGYIELSPNSPYYIGVGFGTIEVPAKGDYILKVRVGIEGKKVIKTEAWISILEYNNAQLRHELCLRILIK